MIQRKIGAVGAYQFVTNIDPVELEIVTLPHMPAGHSHMLVAPNGEVAGWLDPVCDDIYRIKWRKRYTHEHSYVRIGGNKNIEFVEQP